MNGAPPFSMVHPLPTPPLVCRSLGKDSELPNQRHEVDPHRCGPSACLIFPSSHLLSAQEQRSTGSRREHKPTGLTFMSIHAS